MKGCVFAFLGYGVAVTLAVIVFRIALLCWAIGNFVYCLVGRDVTIGRACAFAGELPGWILDKTIEREELGDVLEFMSSSVAAGKCERELVRFYLWSVVVSVINSQRYRFVKFFAHTH